jgi:hypothetical protein
MAELWKDGFDHYGTSTAGGTAMLEGAWAQISGSAGPAIPAFGARTGTYSLEAPANALYRRIYGADVATTIISFAFATTSLPATEGACFLEIRDNTNTPFVGLSLSTTGVITARTGTFLPGTSIGATASPVITASTWHHLEIKCGVTAETFTLKVDGTTVLSLSGLSFSPTTASQIALRGPHAASSVWFDDLIVRDDSGTRNNDFMGDLRIATLYPDSDEAAQGWTPRYRAKYGAGILDNRTSNSGVSAVDATALRLGNATYTLEGFFRFYELPTTTDKAVLLGKWTETGNLREWQLYKAGPDLNSGRLVFRVSTDGSAATTIHEHPWEPELHRWYHVAVVRDGTDSMLFIDGVMQGTVKTDSNTYFGGAATQVIGAQMSSTTAIVTGTFFDGFIDEVRLTNGVARYTTDFTPPSAIFGRNVGADADFASVTVLAGFDSSIADESSFARTLTARGSAVRFAVDDGDDAYQTINQSVPRDDTFIEAAHRTATGTFQLDDTPSNNETVVLGATTYTFKTALSPAANEVLSGADADESLENLVAAITAGAGSGTLYGGGTTANASATAEKLPDEQILARALSAGAAGNTIASTETCVDGAWLQGATLEGGEDIPSESEFGFQPLTQEATVVRSVSLVYRAYKSSSGTCDVQVSMVDAADAVDLGTENALSTNPIYYEDVFDEDPTTGSGLTPSFVSGMKARVDRTN